MSSKCSAEMRRDSENTERYIIPLNKAFVYPDGDVRASPEQCKLGLHRTWGVDEIDAQISQETLKNHENP